MFEEDYASVEILIKIVIKDTYNISHGLVQTMSEQRKEGQRKDCIYNTTLIYSRKAGEG